MVFECPCMSKGGVETSNGCGDIACKSSPKETLLGPGGSRHKIWL
jgi:hypothetical protein